MRLVKLAIFVCLVGVVSVLSYTYVNGHKAEDKVIDYLKETENINEDDYYIKYSTDATVEGTFIVKVVNKDTDEIKHYIVPNGKVKEEIGYEEW